MLVRPAFGADGEAPRAVVAHHGEFDEVDGGHVVLNALVLTRDGPRLEIVNFQTADGVAEVWWIDHDDAGRPVRFAKRQDFDRILVAECTWEGDRCVGVESRSTENGRTFITEMRFGEYDDEGLLRVHREMDTTGWYERLVWDRARDAWVAEPAPLEDDLEAWITWLEAAVRERLPGDAAVAVLSAMWGEQGPSLSYLVRADFDAVRHRAREPVDLILAADRTVEFGTPPSELWRSLRQRDRHAYADAAFAHLEALQSRLADLPAVVSVGGAMNDRLVALLDERPAAAAPPPATLPRTRDDLLALLRVHDLPERLVDQARWAAAIVVRPKGTGSRLGGPPRLPAGVEWPRSPVGRLTHLVTIAFAEVPAFPGRDSLPADGTLVLLADLTEDAALWEPTTVGGDDRVAVLFFAPGAAIEEAAGRSRPSIRERGAGFEPFLALPEHAEGLSTAEEVAYGHLYDALLEVMPGHWLLGHPDYQLQAQFGPDERHLLHVGTAPLGVDYMDGGTLTLSGKAADLAARRWEALTVRPESA